MLQGLESK
jgi:hypothetical protein